MSARPFAIGADPDDWPGLAKLIEECAEVVQLGGKIMAYPDGDHPDGEGPLDERLADELGDLLAAVAYHRAHNRRLVRLKGRIELRLTAKFHLFQRWHAAEDRPTE